MIRAALILLLSCLSAQALWLSRQSPDMGIGGQDSWTSLSNSTSYPYFFLGYDYRLFSGTSQVTADLGETVAAGTYYVWFRLDGTATGVTIQVGDVSNTVAKASSDVRWLRTEVMTPSVSFSNVVITITAGTSAARRFHGLIITDDSDWMQCEEQDGLDNNEGIEPAHDVTYSAQLFFRKPEPVVTTNYQSGNLLRYGTMEFGATVWGTPYEDTRTAGPRFRGPQRDRFIEGSDMPQGSRAIGIWSTAAGTNTLAGWTHLFEVRRTPGLRITNTVSFYARSATNTINLGVQVLPMLRGTTSISATNVWDRTNTVYDVTVSIPAGSSWNRYEFAVPLDTSPSPYYLLKFDHTSSDVVFLDGLMVNEGPSAETFVAYNPAEWVMRGTNRGNYYHITSAKTVECLTHNAGAAFTRTLDIDEFGPNGQRYTNWQTSFLVATNTATNTFTLRSGKVGPIRVIARAADQPNDQQEAVFTVVYLSDPYGPMKTNSLIGTHMEPDTEEVDMHRSIGIHWSRSLMSQYFEADQQWPDPGTTTNFTLIADHEIGQQTNALILASLGDKDAWPSHMVTNTFPSFVEAKRTNWAWIISARYPELAMIEAGNEPQNQTNYTQSATNWLTLAAVHALDLSGLTNANDQTYVGFGGIANITDFPSNAWTQIVADGLTNKIPFLSYHVYANGSEIDNWNTLADTEDDIDDWHQFGADRGVAMINSESGAYNWAGKASQWFVMDESEYQAWIPYQTELQLIRGLYFDPLRLMTMWRSVGRGDRWFYYASRNSLQPWNWDSGDGLRMIDGGLKPTAAILSVAATTLGEPTIIGRFTNSSATSLECYAMDTGAGQGMVVVYGQQAGKVLSATLTNASFGVFDWYGNSLQTNNSDVAFVHNPRYLISDTLSGTQLMETVQEATFSSADDADGATVAVLISPHDQSPTAPYRFRWFANAPNGLNNDRRFPEAIRTRWSLNGTNWSAWGTRGMAKVDSLASGTYALQVEALDPYGVTNVAFGPSFTLGAATGTINAGTVNVGTLNITQ